MADTLTDFIIKPSAPFAAGVILFGVVWGFFKGVESVLTDDTKLEIAIWLVGVKPLSAKVEPWPETFGKVFDRVFGTKHLSWSCFYRSFISSMALYVMVLIAIVPPVPAGYSRIHLLSPIVLCGIVGNVIPDYVSLLSTRMFLRFAKMVTSTLVLILFLALDCLATSIIALMAVAVAKVGMVFFEVVVGSGKPRVMWDALRDPNLLELVRLSFKMTFTEVSHSPLIYFFRLSDHKFLLAWFYPAFFTSIWLWLYAGSGFLLKAARRFDIGFDWFNRKFDIEKKPLSAIGLVAGALVAVTYWGFVVGAYLVKK